MKIITAFKPILILTLVALAKLLPGQTNWIAIKYIDEPESDIKTAGVSWYVL